jgi:anti-sigma B factor antagonist
VQLPILPGVRSVTGARPVLTLELAHTDGGCTVRCGGEIDLATAERLRDVLDRVVADGTGRVVLDIGDVTFIDSNGLNAIVTAYTDLRARGRTLQVRRPSRQARRLFAISLIDTIVDIR